MLGRPKGGTNRYWSKEEKLRIITRWMNGEGSISEIARLKGFLEECILIGSARIERKENQPLRIKESQGIRWSGIKGRRNLPTWSVWSMKT